MEQYKQEREFLKTTPLDESFIAVGKHRIYPLIFLTEYKAYLIEQAKKGKLTKEEIWNDVFESLTSHTENFSWYVFKSMGIYANQFIYDDELGTATNDMLKNRIKQLEKEVQQYRDNQFIPADPAEQWISVKDKLPEEGEHILVSDLGGTIKIAWFGRRTSMDDVDFRYANITVTHWMPLPAAPESTTSTKQP